MSRFRTLLQVVSSALALVLVGALATWLWLDATSLGRDDSPGVVVGAAAAAEGPGGVPEPAAEQASAARLEQLRERGAVLNQEVARLAAQERMLTDFAEQVRLSMDELAIAGDAAEAERVEAAAKAKEKRAKEKAAKAEKEKAAKAAAEKAAAEKTARERAARQPAPAPAPAPAPQPVQPAPVTPPGLCWDDDEWEECDDDEWDDEWDD